MQELNVLRHSPPSKGGVPEERGGGGFLIKIDTVANDKRQFIILIVSGLQPEIYLVPNYKGRCPLL